MMITSFLTIQKSGYNRKMLLLKFRQGIKAIKYVVKTLKKVTNKILLNDKN